MAIPTNVNGFLVTSIGVGAFEFCGITSVSIPNTVTNIGDAAFFSCFSLMTFSVNAFNPAYSSLDGVLFNKNQTTLIQWPQSKAASFTIPNSVTTIGAGAFADCTRLTNVTIGNSVTIIGEGAFQCCYGLTNVTMLDSDTSIGFGAFAECTSLTSITIPNSVTNIGEGAFQ